MRTISPLFNFPSFFFLKTTKTNQKTSGFLEAIEELVSESSSDEISETETKKKRRTLPPKKRHLQSDDDDDDDDDYEADPMVFTSQSESGSDDSPKAKRRKSFGGAHNHLW